MTTSFYSNVFKGLGGVDRGVYNRMLEAVAEMVVYKNPEKLNSGIDYAFFVTDTILVDGVMHVRTQSFC